MQQDEHQEAEGTENVVDDEYLDLPSGDYLSPTRSATIASRSPTRLIVIAGGAECGKTTLLASIFELFQRGPFAGFSFAGSRTLLGLEKRCHLARIASNRSSPETEHTQLSPEDTLLHLRVRELDMESEPIDLLFTDLAGERFRLARDSTDECRRLGILKRADRFVVMLDGAKLSDAAGRHAAYADGRSLLRSCLDAEMLDIGSQVDVLISKLDIIEKHDGDGSVRTYIETIKSALSDDFSGRVAGLRFIEVAASPVEDTRSLGHNLHLCFPDWARVFIQRSYVGLHHPPIATATREMDRYGIRRTTE